MSVENPPEIARAIAMDAAAIIATELSLTRPQVEATLALFAGGATMPFIARYRKEATGGLDEVQISAVQDRGAYLTELLARKETVVHSINEQGKLTPALLASIARTLSKTELEDLYLPFKPKRRTRAQIARERGLEPLGKLILDQQRGLASRVALAAPFVDAAKEVPDTEAAYAGARDIVAEFIAEKASLRAVLRKRAESEGSMRSKAVRNKEVEGAKFKDYFQFEELARTLPSHRILALRRGEKEGFLSVTLELNREEALVDVRRHVVKDTGATLAAELEAAVVDSWDRLLAPAIEVDVRLSLKERADLEAIKVFAENLRHLLLAAPLGGKRVLAVDPGFRTGCKLVALDETGTLLENDLVYVAQSEGRQEEAERKLTALCAKHKIEAIAVGNGTAGREAESLLRKLAKEDRLGGAVIVVVSESGASVYSASEIAREELPDQDVTVRGAVSIGRRLQDPLAELVKIDPKAIGVGQYQHDVHQPTLEKSLDTVIESCVSSVGVDANTASVKLLRYVAGVGETLAKSIFAHRVAKGAFKSRAALREVPRLGPKAFEQAAGFLRVRGGHPLDNSAVHPESYDLVERMAKDLGVEIADLIGNTAHISRIDPTRYIDEKRGELTLRDIIEELKKPGRDPRAQFEAVTFRDDVTAFEHLKIGMVLDGIVTNVTRFGAFVDVGVHHDGLVHVSELSHRFIKDPSEVTKVGERVKVKVLGIDDERRRFALSVKQTTAAPAHPATNSRPQTATNNNSRPDLRGPASGSARPNAPTNKPANNPGGNAANRPPVPPRKPAPPAPPAASPFNSIRFKKL